MDHGKHSISVRYYWYRPRSVGNRLSADALRSTDHAEIARAALS
jgi:hypothetical protein